MTEDPQQGKSTARDDTLVGRVQEQIGALTTLHAALTDPITDILREALQTGVEVRTVSVNHTLAFRVVQWFPYPSCTFSFRPEVTQQPIFFDIHMELAAAMVGREIGVGDAIRVVDVCQLSQKELPRIGEHAKRIMREIVALWDDTVAMEIIEPMIETSPVLVIADPTEKAADAEDPVFHVKFEVKWGEHLSYIELCYPSPSLAAGLSRLQKTTDDS